MVDYFMNCKTVGGENQVAINLIVKHVHLKLQEVHRCFIYCKMHICIVPCKNIFVIYQLLRAFLCNFDSVSVGKIILKLFCWY